MLLRVKCKRKDKLRKELLREKEPEPNDLGNSEPIQIAKNAKIRRFTVRKVCSGRKERV